MKIHLFGLPLSAHRRLKAESSNWDDAVPTGHSFRATPRDSNRRTDFRASELRELSRGIEEGFVHIVIPASRSWNDVQRCLEFDCRVHAARLREPIESLDWGLLRAALHEVVTLDAVWLNVISPKDLRHALLLPPAHFRTNRVTRAYWKRCCVYSRAQIPGAESLLNLVESHHRRTDGNGVRSWVDNDGRRFRFDPSGHGLSEADRSGVKSYRFCFEIPPGFHFDVTHDTGRSFEIQLDGRSERATHCNITPWGHVRRG